MRTGAAIIAALSTLPKDLQDTYQRALDKVPRHDRIYLRRSMLWLTWSLHPLKLKTLIDAIVLESGMRRFKGDERLHNPENLLDICGVFATEEDELGRSHEDRQIRPAHHSVRDFFSVGVAENSEYRLPAKTSHIELAALCLAYLLLEDWTDLHKSGPEAMRKEVSQNELLQYAARSWPLHVRLSDGERELQLLISKLMTP